MRLFLAVHVLASVLCVLHAFVLATRTPRRGRQWHVSPCSACKHVMRRPCADGRDGPLRGEEARLCRARRLGYVSYTRTRVQRFPLASPRVRQSHEATVAPSCPAPCVQSRCAWMVCAVFTGTGLANIYEFLREHWCSAAHKAAHFSEVQIVRFSLLRVLVQLSMCSC
eukprot:5837743-Pleurochrysis_carterae.AAC.1